MHENSILYFLNHLISAVLRLLPLLSSPINPGLQWEIRWKIYGRANRASLIIHSSNFTDHLVSGCPVISSLATKTQPCGGTCLLSYFWKKRPSQDNFLIWKTRTAEIFSFRSEHMLRIQPESLCCFSLCSGLPVWGWSATSLLLAVPREARVKRCPITEG